MTLAALGGESAVSGPVEDSLLWWGVSSPSVNAPNGVVDSIGTLAEAQYVENPNVTWDGVGFLTVPGLAGTETITVVGTAVPAAAVGAINFGSGTCDSVSIDGVETYTFSEDSGATVYDITGAGNHATLSDTSLRTRTGTLPWGISGGYTPWSGFDLSNSQYLIANNTEDILSNISIGDSVFKLTLDPSGGTTGRDYISQKDGSGVGRTWLRLKNSKFQTYIGGMEADISGAVSNSKQVLELFRTGASEVTLHINGSPISFPAMSIGPF